MDGSLARGGAAALFALGAALPVSAQSAGPVPAAVRERDTVIVRMIDAGARVRLDSIKVLMRLFEGEPLTSPASARIRQELDAMTMALGKFSTFGPAGPQFFLRGTDGARKFEALQARGWLGITTAGSVPHKEWSDGGHFVQYFAYPSIESVEQNSPAQRAGIVPGDTLVAYDGADVVGRVINLTQMLTPDRKLAVTVRRGGEDKEYSVVVGRAPVRIVARQFDNGDGDFTVITPGEPRAEGTVKGFGGRGGPRPVIVGDNGFGGGGQGPQHVKGFFISLSGVFGASLMTLEPALAKSLNLQPGVLVKDVAEATAADRAGLHIGDVIVAVSGQPVTSLGEVQILSARSENRSVTMQVIREKKPRTITVSW